MYFSKEGNYGDTDSMTDDTEWSIVVPTSHWTPEMLKSIDGVRESSRFDLAKHFNVNVHKINAVRMQCYVCALPMDQLDKSAVMEGWRENHEMALSIDE